MPDYIRAVLINPHVEVDRTRFPFTLPAFKDYEYLKLDPKITFFVGENGSGKSTLLEAIAVNFGMPAEGGSRQHRFSTFDSHSELHEKIMLQKGLRPDDTFFLRAESLYNMASYVDRAAREAGVPPRFGFLHNRSHGESFIDIVNGLKPEGLYLFDEPESALSPQRQLAFLVRIGELLKAHCQILIASHSPIILSFPGALIYQFSEAGIQQIEYEETEHYWLTLDYLKNRKRYMDRLGVQQP